MKNELKCLGIGYDKQHTIPCDITAAKVLFSKGTHYDAELKQNTTLNQDCPHEMQDWDRIPPMVLKDPNFVDYRGRRVGDFVVVGLLKYKYNTWVLRCCCGQYEIRRTTTLNKPITNLQQTCCGLCMDLKRLRNKEYFKKHGRYPWDTGKRTVKKSKSLKE